MSDALRIPPRPSLEQYKKLARDCQRACKSTEPDAIRTWAARWLRTLARLQRVDMTAAAQTQIDAEVELIDRRWREFKRSGDRRDGPNSS